MKTRILFCILLLASLPVWAVDPAPAHALLTDAAGNPTAPLNLNGPNVRGVLPPRSIPGSVLAFGAMGDGVTDDTAAFQAALNAGGHIVVPRRATAYVISDALVIHSGTWLDVDADQVIYEASGSNTVMIINEHPYVGGGDHDIRITGGYWDCNWIGNPGLPLFSAYSQFRSSKAAPIKGISGVINMINVVRTQVSDLTVKNAILFSVQMSQSNDFRVERINFVRDRSTISDGVHLNGPSTRFVIRDLRGATGDDFVAVNAWDWSISSPAGVQGPITDGYIGNLRPDSSYYTSVKLCAGNGASAGIRNLTIEDVKGSSVGCPFIWGTLGDGADASNTVTPGQIANVTLRDVAIHVTGPATPYGIGSVFSFDNGIYSGIRLENIVVDATHQSYGTGPWFLAGATATVNDLTVDKLTMLAPNTTSYMFQFQCPVGDLKILNSTFVSDGVNTGSQAYSVIGLTGGGGALQRVTLQNTAFLGTPAAVYNSAGTSSLVTLSGCRFSGAHCGILYSDSGTCRLVLNANTFLWPMGPYVNNQAGNTIVTSAGNVVLGSATTTLLKGTGGIRWDGIDVPLDGQYITDNDGDWFWNTNPSLGIPLGRIRLTGGAWFSL